MKSLVWKGVFVFSIALNVAVASTVGYHLWRVHGWYSEPGYNIPAQFFGTETKQALEKPEATFSRTELQEKRRRLQEKKKQVLDIIAAHPGDLEPAKAQIEELIRLQAQMETAALVRISKIMAELPSEKRQQFLVTLTNRACRGPGMKGRGFGHRAPNGYPLPAERPFEPSREK